MFKFNTDGFARLSSYFTGLGMENYDPLNSTQVNDPPKYSKQELTTFYRSLWGCRKVCDYMPEAMARGWGKLVIEDNEILEQNINNQIDYLYGLRERYCEAQKQANLYGGAVVVRLMKDLSPPETPININEIIRNKKELEYSQILTPWEISPVFAGIGDFKYPEFYQVNINESLINLHKSRVVRFRGASIDNFSIHKNNGFEDSLLLPFVESFTRYLSAHSFAGASLKSFEFVVHKIGNLFESLETKGNEQKIAQRLRDAYRSVSALRGIVLDKDEEAVEIVSRRFSGISEMLEKLEREMVAASGLTYPQFLQEHPSGLAATGESERLAEADRIQSNQVRQWGKNIFNDCRLILASNGVDPNSISWRWEWSNLFQQTPLEAAETQLKLAQAEQIKRNTPNVGGARFSDNF